MGLLPLRAPFNLSRLTARLLGGDSPRVHGRTEMRSLALCLAVSLFPLVLAGQAATPRPAPSPPVLIKAGRLIDGRSDTPQANVGILVEGERITWVGPLA